MPLDFFNVPSGLLLVATALMLFGFVDGLAWVLQWVRTRRNRRGK